MPKGVSGNPKGRPKGTLNHRTVAFQDALTNLLNFAAPKMVEWLDEVARTDGPLKALGVVSDFAEYKAPKLSRAEYSGPNGGPIQQKVTVEFVGSHPDTK